MGLTYLELIRNGAEEFSLNSADISTATNLITKPPGYVWRGTATLPTDPAAVYTAVAGTAPYGALKEAFVPLGTRAYDAAVGLLLQGGAVAGASGTVSAVDGDAKTVTCAASAGALWNGATGVALYLVPPGNWAWAIHMLEFSIVAADTLVLQEYTGAAATTLFSWKLPANGGIISQVPFVLAKNTILRVKTTNATPVSVKVWASPVQTKT